MLAVGAMVASLLAVGTSPAVADEEKADHKAATSACVGPAEEAHGFSDVSDMSEFSDAISCVKYYKITTGSGDGSTFSPDDEVTRDEMAVFLARAAGVAGVDLGEAMDAGFGDIADTWDDARHAINRLAEKGIIPKGDSYRPRDNMTRAEMAVALVGLLDAAGAIDIRKDGTIDLGDDGPEDDADDYFADARALSPQAADRASAALYELGVTNGGAPAAVVDDSKTPLDVNFDPNGDVTRGEMAAFITRALAHTSARPAGVTAQQVGNTVLVSVRGEDFAPEINAYVDVFWIEAADEDDALDDGACGPRVRNANGDFVCEIDGDDLLTVGTGDIATTAIPVPEGGAVAWAWTGDIGDEFDTDEVDVSRVELEKMVDAETSTTAHISTDLEGSMAKMGSSFTVTLQLQNDDGDDVTGGAEEADEPAKWIATIRAFSGTPADVSSASPVRVRTVRFESDPDGKGTFMVDAPPDPDPDTRGQSWTVQYTVTADPNGCTADTAGTAWISCSAPVAAEGTPPAIEGTPPAIMSLPTISDGDLLTNPSGQDNTGLIVFSDARAAAEEIEIDTSSYVVVARAGRKAVNRATVKVTDQYGDPVSKAKITLTSDRGQGDGTNQDSSLTDTPANAQADGADSHGRVFLTESDGTYPFSYTWSGDGAIETLSARTTAIPADGNANIKTKMVHWAQDADPTGTTAEVVAGDVDANQIVVVVDEVPMVVTYDDDDRFNLQATNATPAVTSGVPSSMAAFEKALAAALEPGAADVNLIWSNYRSGPRNTSELTLDTSPS